MAAYFRRTLCTLNRFFIFGNLMVLYLLIHLPFSGVYIGRLTSPQMKQRVRIKNSENRNISLQYLLGRSSGGEMSSLSKSRLHVNDETTLIVVVISVQRRQNPGYLTQVSAGLMKSGLPFFVCNAEKNPTLHSEAIALETLGVVVRNVYSRKNANELKVNSFEKEKIDYRLCLRLALEYSTKFLVALEDDALPLPDFQSTTLSLINDRDFLLRNNWCYIKLFYPIKWLSFSPKSFDHICEVFLLSTVCTFVVVLVTCLFMFCLKFLKLLRCHGMSDNKFRWKIKYVFATFLYCCMMCLFIGRARLLEIRRLHPTLRSVVPAPGCCTPAVLYQRDKAYSIISYLDNQTCNSRHPFDVAMDKFNCGGKYLIQPSIVEHIGMISTIKTDKNAAEFLVF